jgi:hypothetical protein
VTITVATPSEIKLVRSDVVVTSTEASTAPPTIDATDTASKTPMTRPRTSAATTRATAVSATTSHATNPAPPITVATRAITSRSTLAYTSWVRQNASPVATTIHETFVLAARRPLKIVLSSPPSPTAASR